ncbi:phosphoribosyl transferase [Salipaludibacillus keqinensis]|uniref:Phosphoribosyl transferase n=1 Tax=Salipaludibacillus keqinensis TaxID=2045207 RepID=A0A323TRC0_9BACI|nr:phosphoribosyl transferase [Salipaludibacillus keqinensis]PYZ95083.1 phosphoribosyl transferase [Salipaludibacillus keqinensis]
MIYKTYSDLSNLILNKISLLQGEDYDLIVGVSEAGMVPAYMIALYLNKHCCDLETFTCNHKLKAGISRNPKVNIEYPFEAKKILLVEDTNDSGHSFNEKINRVPNLVKKAISTICIYSSKPLRNDVDNFLEYIPGDFAFEWNIFHENFTSNSCFDIDGVLCVDPSGEQDDDGEKYKEFLINAALLLKPKGKIKYLVTSRLEKYRKETESWLLKNEIEYEFLIMLDLPSKEERQKLNMNAIHKAEALNNSKQELFYESSHVEAFKIHELTQKPVYCMETNKLYSKETMGLLSFGEETSKFSKRTLFLITQLNKLPKPFYNTARNVYRFFVY